MLEASVKMQQQLESKWLPPDEPSHKINVDGAVFASQKEAGVGVVIRDHEGKFIAGICKKFQVPLGAVEVEAKALEAGMFFAVDMGIQDFILEGDSFNLVRALQDNSPAPTSVTNLIYEVQAMSYEF